MLNSEFQVFIKKNIESFFELNELTNTFYSQFRPFLIDPLISQWCTTLTGAVDYCTPSSLTGKHMSILHERVACQPLYTVHVHLKKRFQLNIFQSFTLST